MIASRILGRQQELILTGTGRLISMTAINMHDDLFDDLRQFQFLQERAGEVVFRYVPRTRLADQQVERIRRGLVGKLGDDVRLSLVAVDSIPRTRSGKLSFLDQRLPISSDADRESQAA